MGKPGGRRLLTSLALIALAEPAIAARPLAIDDVAGVYRVEHKTGDGGVRVVDAEDILEVVKVSPTSAYVRTRLIRQNGHICALHGVAEFKNGRLNYHARREATDGGQPCAMEIGREGQRLVLHDHGTCSANCGAFSSFEGMGFPAKSRRPIRYIDRLKASREYAEAQAERRQGR